MPSDLASDWSRDGRLKINEVLTIRDVKNKPEMGQMAKDIKQSLINRLVFKRSSDWLNLLESDWLLS